MSISEGKVSALGPVDPYAQILQEGDDGETEKSAPWIVRKLVESMTGRIVMASYESLKATGTSVVCLSPWGDSSPLLLPCVRFRDLVVSTAIAATGGVGAVAAPVMSPVADIILTSLGSSIVVELGIHAGFEATTKLANDLVFDKTLKVVIPTHSKRLETTAVKVLLITLKYKHTKEDAALGFFRSGVHKDTNLISTVKDYLATEKGWFSPYLYASGRRPVIPRAMKPDVVFCHGPFLQGDYSIGTTLLVQSASAIALCDAPLEDSASVKEKDSHHLKLPSLSNFTDMLRRSSRSPSPTSENKDPSPEAPAVPAPSAPRRMVILLVGLKPHRMIWTSSARPGESVINYVLLNGTPAIVVPVKTGSPLIAWDALMLTELWKIPLPLEDEQSSATGQFEGIAEVLTQFIEFCIDWDRMTIEGDRNVKREAIRAAFAVLVAAAIRSKDSKEARKEVDPDRTGIAMWRIP